VKQRPEPKIAPHEGSPPTKLVVRDLIRGKGPEARVGDHVTVAYRGEFYVSGVLWSSSWEKIFPLRLELGSRSEGEGFERGIQGMKLGGRREIIIPPRLIYEQPFGTSKEDTLVYVLDLLAVD